MRNHSRNQDRDLRVRWDSIRLKCPARRTGERVQLVGGFGMPEVAIWWYIGIGSVSALKRTYDNRQELVYMLEILPTILGAALVLGMMVFHAILWLPILLSRMIPHR